MQAEKKRKAILFSLLILFFPMGFSYHLFSNFKDPVNETIRVVIVQPNIDPYTYKFNVGYENQSVNKLSQIVQDVVGQDVEIIKTETDDNRSYHISSEKIKKRLGFEAKSRIRHAVVDLVKAFETGKLQNTFDDEKYFNIKRMQSLNLN